MRRAAAVTLIATGAVLAVTLTASNEPKQPPTAGQVVGFLNSQRTTRHLSRLRSDRSLTLASKRWSLRLTRTGAFEHQPLSLVGGWSWLAETLYRGPGGPVKAWLRSPPHRAILLSRRARLIGVGRSGDTWVGRFGAR